MKISKETVNVLKNLATINPNLLIKEGSTLKSISPAQNVMAAIAVEEEFTQEFGIYDLSQFLGVLAVYDEPDVDFQAKVASIKQGKSKITYTAADASILVVPTKNVKFPEAEINFQLEAADLTKAIKTAGVLNASDLIFEGDGDKLFLVVTELKTPSSNSYRVEIGESDKSFKAILKVDNLKLLPSDYKVSISSKKISRFVSTDGKADYFIALESTSSF